MNSSCNLQATQSQFLNLDEVHVWSACLPDNEKNMSYFTSLLSKDESKKAESFRFPKDKMYFIISRGILRCLLAKYLECSPQCIEIMYGLWGKPCVLAVPPLHFNLSHSREHVLYAITRICTVGIDLEYIDETLDIDPIALSILSPQELNCWKMVKKEEKKDAFFKLWVCKEAFLKASGKGWLADKQTIPLEGLEVFKKYMRNKSLNKNISLPYCFDSIPGYASALFIDAPPLNHLYYKWNSQI